MVTVRDVFGALNALYPVERRMELDNVGLLVGSYEREVATVLVSLDITEAAIDEAVRSGAELIVSHHPVIFTPLRSLTEEDVAARPVMALVRRGISTICMHTNLDVSRGGVNDALIARLGVTGKTDCLTVDGTEANGESYGLGRVGELAYTMALSDLLPIVRERLGANGLRYVDAGRPVHKIAVCGGSGGSELPLAYEAGCDTYVTADVKYNTFLDAKALGINLIDAGHFPTENVIVPALAEKIAGLFPGISVKTFESGQPEKFYK